MQQFTFLCNCILFNIPDFPDYKSQQKMYNKEKQI